MIVEPMVSVAAHAGVGPGVGEALADWFTVINRPAAVSVPVRAAPVFASIVKVKVPLPEPDAPSDT